MASAHEALRDAGIETAGGYDRPPLLLAECARMARVLREHAVSTVGLAPAGDDVAVPAIAIEIGRALASGIARAVGVVDACGNWPCAGALTGCAAPDGKLLATSWVLDNLAVLTPRSPEPGAVVGHLRNLVIDEAAIFSHLVVDLTGLDHLGLQMGAFEVLDAVVLVARSGQTTTRQVERWLRDFPDARWLGVLLTGL